MSTTESNVVFINAPRNDATIESTEIKPNGADAMRDAANEQLIKDCKAITKALSDSAQEGHMMAARLLYMIGCDLMRITAEDLVKRKSLATEWAAEKQWTEEMKKTPEESAASIA